MSSSPSIPSNDVAIDRKNLDLTMFEFKQTFEDHEGFTDVATTIVRLLMTHIDLPSTDKNSPVHTHGRDMPSSKIMEELQVDVATNLSDSRNINLLPAFFHPGGVYYSMMTSIMNEYWNYIDLAHHMN